MEYAGATHPALPQEEPAATSSRSTTVTLIPRSWRNHAVDRPTMPAPTTTTSRGARVADSMLIPRGWDMRDHVSCSTRTNSSGRVVPGDACTGTYAVPAGEAG